MSATLHLVSGLPGAGKTTFAKALAEELGAARFCPDDWMHSANIGMRNWRFREQLEKQQLLLALLILDQGKDAIIEWGTWGADERIKVATVVHENGHFIRGVFLTSDQEVLKSRIAQRNKVVAPDLVMSEKEFEQATERWQAPSEDELAVYDAVVFH